MNPDDKVGAVLAAGGDIPIFTNSLISTLTLWKLEVPKYFRKKIVQGEICMQKTTKSPISAIWFVYPEIQRVII